MDILSSELLAPSKISQFRVLQPTLGQVVTNLDLPAIGDLIDELSRSGYDDVVHLVSFGGWKVRTWTQISLWMNGILCGDAKVVASFTESIGISKEMITLKA
jgi:hypothetical protein